MIKKYLPKIFLDKSHHAEIFIKKLCGFQLEKATLLTLSLFQKLP